MKQLCSKYSYVRLTKCCLCCILANLGQDEERMAKLEDDLKHIRTKAEEADKQYDEVSKKLQVDFEP